MLFILYLYKSKRIKLVGQLELVGDERGFLIFYSGNVIYEIRRERDMILRIIQTLWWKINKAYLLVVQ
jgi:hypothetical protein